MKLQKLTIHNIASIQDAVIDFDAEPLANCEVFLITGKTGAGKSTILDAICLALYADTPRLYNTKMQGVTLDANKEVKIDDPRQLMRRNTAEAYVTLSFLGSNGIRYEAEWSVARAYKKTNGTIKNKSWQLKNLNTNTVLTKDIDIKSEIKEAIGLDFSQFCRTTLLAQGEFTRFLNSKDDEKAEILEKITGVDIYSKIGAKVFNLTNLKKQEWEDSKRIIEGIHSLSDMEIASKKAAITALEMKSSELRLSMDKLDGKRQWLKNENDLKKGIADATEELRLANEIINSEEFKQKETLIKEWNATIDARGWIVEMTKAKTSSARINQILEKLEDDFSNLLAGQKAIAQEKKRIEDKLASIDAFLEKEKERVPVYENAQTIAGYLNAISDCRRSIQKNQEEVRKEKKKLTETLTPACDRTNSAISSAQKAIDEKEKEIKADENEIATLNLPKLRAQRDALKELLNKTKIAKERIEALRQETSRKDNLRNRLENQLSILNQKSKLALSMDSTIHDAKLKLEICRETFEKQKDTIDKFVKTLRLKLHIGDTCPVCRQKIGTELPHEEELSAFVMSLQGSYDKAEKEYVKLNETKLKLEAEIKSGMASYEQEKRAFDEDDSVSLAEKRAKEACSECGIDAICTSSTTYLDNLEANSLLSMKHLDGQIEEGENKELIAKGKRSELDTMRKRMSDLARQAQQDESLLNECKGKIATAEMIIKTKEEEEKSAREKAEANIASGNWDMDWHTDPEASASTLLAAAKVFQEMTRKKQTEISLLEKAKITYMNVGATSDAILRLMPGWSVVKPSSTSTDSSDLHSLASNIYSNVTSAVIQKKNAEDIYDKGKASLDSFIEAHQALNVERLIFLNRYSSSMVQEEALLLDNGLKNATAKKALLSSAVSRHDNHLQSRPDFSEDETLEVIDNRLVELEKELAEANEQKGALNQELKNDAENKLKLGMLIEKADIKKSIYLKWSRLNQLIGNATGSTFRKIAQSYILTSLVHAANNYMKTLTDRYTLKVNPGTFVISLEDAYQGFASRAASTISGGESFLISLSLALALSDMGQQWQVDTLFIDEGFGTLSGEPLEKAIETLRSLHSKSGRHVGIISHVEELQERIPVQIQVNQEGHSSSSKVGVREH